MFCSNSVVYLLGTSYNRNRRAWKGCIWSIKTDLDGIIHIKSKSYFRIKSLEGLKLKLKLLNEKPSKGILIIFNKALGNGSPNKSSNYILPCLDSPQATLQMEHLLAIITTLDTIHQISVFFSLLKREEEVVNHMSIPPRCFNKKLNESPIAEWLLVRLEGHYRHKMSSVICYIKKARSGSINNGILTCL